MTDKTNGHWQVILAGGVCAAVFAALLWHSLLNVPLLPIVFGIGVSLPVYCAQFAAGLRAAALAACLAAALLCAALPLSAAPAVACFFFLPALLTGWLLNLRVSAPKAAKTRRPDSGGQTPAAANSGGGAPCGDLGQTADSGFYPLAPALFQLAMAVTFVTVGALAYIFSAPESGRILDALSAQIMQFMQGNGLYDLPAPAGDIQQTLRRLLPVLFAASLALYGFLFQLAALYLSMRLCARKALLKRPLPFWPAELRMPPMAFALCIILWALSYFVSGSGSADSISTLALCLNAALAALSAGFCASGLAVLHQAARGGWLWLRALIYICLFSLVLTPVIFFGLVIMGLLATPLSLRKQGGRPSA